MRCRSCNARLREDESAYRGGHTGEYLDLCDQCISKSEDFPYVYALSGDSSQLDWDLSYDPSEDFD